MIKLQDLLNEGKYTVYFDVGSPGLMSKTVDAKDGKEAALKVSAGISGGAKIKKVVKENKSDVMKSLSEINSLIYSLYQEMSKIQKHLNPKDAQKFKKMMSKPLGDLVKPTSFVKSLARQLESVNERMDKSQAAVTLKQLGGNKFIAMTGAKGFSFGSNGLSFKIGRNAKAVNYVVIDLNAKDLYDIKFQKGSRVLKQVNDVYADQLQKVFTKHTGMYTSL
jgi:hypothetical protein